MYDASLDPGNQGWNRKQMQHHIPRILNLINNE
jgi:hypothetical protein